MAGKQRRQFGSVRKLPSGRYQARYNGPDGLPQSETFATRGDASRWLSRVQADIDRGAWLNPALGGITFSQWAAHYMDGADLRANTRARYESVLKVHLLPAFGKSPMSAITPLKVKSVVDSWKATLAPASVLTNYRVLTLLMNAAVESDLLVKSPCRAKVVKLPAVERAEHRTLTVSELQRLADAMPEQYAPLIWLGGIVGLRWSEAVGLRVKSIDFLARKLTVSATVEEVHGQPLRLVEDTKSEASARTIAIPDFVVSLLSRHMTEQGLTADNPDALLFTTKAHNRGKGRAEVGGGPLRATNFRNRHWNPAVAALGLDGLTFHGLRHVAASLMIDNNEHPRVGQHRLGHATSKLFMEKYSHVSEATDRAAAKRLDDLFSGATGTQVARNDEGDEQTAS